MCLHIAWIPLGAPALGEIHNGRPAERWGGGVVKQLWTHVLIFALKRSNLADAGGGLGVNKKWPNLADVHN